MLFVCLTLFVCFVKIYYGITIALHSLCCFAVAVVSEHALVASSESGVRFLSMSFGRSDAQVRRECCCDNTINFHTKSPISWFLSLTTHLLCAIWYFLSLTSYL